MQRIDRKKVERWPAGHSNSHKNFIVRYREKPYELENGAGSSDDVSVFREGRRVYVLVVNRGMPYVGLDEYDLTQEPSTKKGSGGRFGDGDYESLEPSASMFAQESQVEEVLGPRGTDLTDATMIRKLVEYLG